jgi:stage IV sporulation protein B
MDADGNFGALGHGITDVDTSTLMKMEAGTLYSTQIIGVRRGQKGSPGEMTGMIIYSNERILGEITHNTDEGIYGKCNQKAHAMGDREAIPIALKHEVCVGNAKILCTVGKEETYYDVELVALNPNSVHANRGIELRVTDPELLKLTGGIVQGMSGSPIIQDGKLVGAVTHVLVNDPTRGYGIFIEEMLEAGE